LKTSLVTARLAAVAVLRTEHAVSAEEALVLLPLHDAALEESLHGRSRKRKGENAK